jgi:hypothetical protein
MLIWIFPTRVLGYIDLIMAISRLPYNSGLMSTDSHLLYNTIDLLQKRPLPDLR